MQDTPVNQLPCCIKELPTELIHHIISFVADFIEKEEDPQEINPVRAPDLAACALVCRAWSDITRPYIFRTITIGANSWTSRFSFLQFTSPHLCKYIRELRLSWSKGCLAPEWFTECLNRFTNLLTLRLENGASSHGPLSPPLMPLIGIGSLFDNVPLKRLHLLKWISLKDASDLFHILSSCSASLEEFSLELFDTVDGAQSLDQAIATLPPVIHLPALRSLALLQVIPEIPQATSTCIEIPHLDSLTVDIEDGDSWSIAGWNLHHISDLNLLVPCDSAIPDFGPSICPSHLTINISKRQSRVPYLLVVTWIEGCIDRLPFPNHLQQLTVKIDSSSHTRDKLLYPQSADYHSLYNFFQFLIIISHGSLRRITLIIAVLVQGDAEMPPSFSMDGEVGRLKEVFAPLLETDVLAIDLVLERLHYCNRVWETTLMMQCHVGKVPLS